MEKIKTGDIDSLIERHDYKHCGLYDATGKTIVALNTNKVPLTQKVAQIKKRLSGLPEGFYTLRCQHIMGKKNSAYDYLVQIGNLSETPVMITPQANTQPPTEQVRGWDEALKDKEEIAKLRAENARLAAIETSLQEEEETEEEEEEETSKLSETASVVKDLVPQFLPLAEKYFEQRDKQLELKSRELAIRERELELGIGTRKQVPNSGNLKKVHPFRPVPEVADPKFAEYTNWLQEEGDDIFDVELNYLEKTCPAQFEIIKKLLLEPDEKTA